MQFSIVTSHWTHQGLFTVQKLESCNVWIQYICSWWGGFTQTEVCRNRLGALMNNVMFTCPLSSWTRYMRPGLTLWVLYAATMELTHTNSQSLNFHNLKIYGVHLWAIERLFDPDYRKVSNIRRTKSQNLNDSRRVLQLSFPYPLKSGVKSRMKM